MVTQGFQPGIMPKTYTKLSAQEVSDLVAYFHDAEVARNRSLSRDSGRG